LSKIEHRNLVRWRGYLEHGDEKILVVEYVSNGTLREHLDGEHVYKETLMISAIPHSLCTALLYSYQIVDAPNQFEE